MKTSSLVNNDPAPTLRSTRRFNYVKIFLLGLVICAGLSSCVVYERPYHHHYCNYWR